MVQGKTRVIDLDLRAYFDSVRQDLLLQKVARRVNDADVMRLLKLILKSTGKKGVPQGGVISPVLSNVYLSEVDKMLEKAIEATRRGQYTQMQYARFADDLVILISSHPRQDWVVKAVDRRLREELAKLKVEINEEKTRMVNLTKGRSFDRKADIKDRDLNWVVGLSAAVVIVKMLVVSTRAAYFVIGKGTP